MKNKNIWLLWIFLLHFTFIYSFAATYTLDGTKNALPSCGGNSNNWTISGTTYTCSNNSITFSYGDTITSTGNYTLSVANGMTFNGNNTVGSSTYSISLFSPSGGITFYNTNNTVYGSIQSSSNAITLYGTTVYGNITATVNTVYLINSTIIGNIYSGGGSGIITNNTNITATTITSANNTISITGGTISGAISTSGGSGVQLYYVTMTSGSITTQNVPVSISGSTIGSLTSSVTISSGNYVYVLNSSTVYATITAPVWTNVQTIIKDFTSVIYGTCSPNTGEPCQEGLVVEYRFDECSWNGTAGEVLDSSANSRNATRYNALSNSSTSPSVLCKYSNGASATTGYLRPQTNFAIPSTWTLTTWVKFPLNTAGKYYVFGSVVDTGESDLAYFSTSASDNTVVKWGVSSSQQKSFASNLTGWHHIALTKSGNKTTIFLDGAEVNSISKGVSGTLNYILTSKDDPSNQALSTNVDEFKIFGSVLSDSQIQTIYDNEYAGKNFDGSTRTCPCAETLQTCFTDNFNRTSLGSKWSIISTGTYPPDITDNKLMLTKNKTNISSGVSLIGSFPSSNNLIEIEFEHNAYGGNGADGVTVVLSDANITPVAGAYGGSLGYAQKSSIAGFAGGWLGFGLDEYGNFANDNEGRGNSCSTHPSTSTILDSVTIRGKQGTTRYNGYCFIANSGNLNTLTGAGIDNTSSSTAAPSYKYKFIIDTRSGTIVTAKRDINDGNGYAILPNMNGVDATQVATAPENFRLSFTGSTGDNYNFHSVDNLTIKALSCGTLGQEQIINNFFDAWDTGASYSINNRKIQTKIVNSSFNVNIASLNAANSAYQDFSGTTCVRVVDSTDTPLTNWSKLLFTASNPTINTVSLQSPTASKDNRIKIKWKKGQDIACDSMVEDNSTKSSDNFAIRPNSFGSTLTANQTFIADQSNSITFQANQYGGTGASNYNESMNSSFKVDVDISDPTKTCAVNSIQFSPTINFNNGISTATLYSLPNVGDYTVSMHEIEGAEFAKVDSADTPDAQRYITPYTQTLKVIPSTFLITGTFINGSNGFTYLSNFEQFPTATNRDISAHLDLNISARSATNALLSNYTTLCYAKDANLTLRTNTAGTTLTNLSKFLWYENNHDLNGSVVLDTNASYTIPLSKALFNSTTMGMAETNYRINFDRNSTKPVQPFRFTIQDLNTTDTDLARGSMTLNQNATFYYGRVYSTDYQETSPTIPATIRYEVYCANCNATGFNAIGTQSPLSISWYQNPLHTNTMFGTVSQFAKIGTTTIANPNTSTINAQGFDTSHTLTNATAPYVDRILMTPSAWLIFNPFNANATTNDFNVEFTRSGNWSGAGNVDRNNTSHTTGAFTNDTNITRGNRKMNW